MATKRKRCDCPNKERTMCGHKWYSDLRINGKKIVRALSVQKAESELMMAELIKEQKGIILKPGQLRELPVEEFFVPGVAGEARRPRKKELRIAVAAEGLYLDWARSNKSARTIIIEVRALRRALSTQIKDANGRIVPGPRFVSEMTPSWLNRVKAAWVKDGEIQLTKDNMGLKGAAGSNRDIRAIKTIMRRAYLEWHEDYNIPDFNWRTVEYFRLPNGGRRIVWNSIEELQKIEQHCYGFYFTLFYANYTAGLRLGEVRWLWKDDLDFKRKTITVRAKSWTNPVTGEHESWAPKMNKERVVPMGELLERHLLKVLARHPGNTPFVVCYEDGRTPSESVMSARFRKICQAAGVKSYAHKLRHSFATSYAEEASREGKLDLKKLQEMLGHATMKMTLSYVHAVGLASVKDVQLVNTKGLGLIAHQ